MSSGLLRYRSAPTALLAEMGEDFLPPRPSSPATAAMFARFLHSPERSSPNFEAAENPEVGFSAPQMLYHSPSNLVRHSSSPAGLFNGYGGVGVLSRQNSSGLMPPISEMGDGRDMSAWDDAGMLSGGFSGVKRQRDVGVVVGDLNQTEIQFQQDPVLCKMRAKRGCATHPRSIAERVRRTRISERMRKLQELVPNMDKSICEGHITGPSGVRRSAETLQQTNTADMLDLAVEYIKDLQREAKILSESTASCTCSSKRRRYSSAAA